MKYGKHTKCLLMADLIKCCTIFYLNIRGNVIMSGYLHSKVETDIIGKCQRHQQ